MIQPKKELNCHTSCGTSWTLARPVLVFRVGQIDPFVCRPVLRPVPVYCVVLLQYVAARSKTQLTHSRNAGSGRHSLYAPDRGAYILAGLYTPQGQLQ